MADERSHREDLLWESSGNLSRVTCAVCTHVIEEARDKMVPYRRGVMNCLKRLPKSNDLVRSTWNVSAEQGLLLNQSKELGLDHSKVDRLGR